MIVIKDNNVIYTGGDFPQYNIYTGMDINQVFNNIIAKLERLNQSNVQSTSPNIVLTVNPTQSCEGEITNKVVNLKMTAGVLNVDFNTMIGALPDNSIMAFTETIVYGKGLGNTVSIISNSKSTTSNIPVSAENLPLTVKLKIGINTKCGLLEYENSYNINSWDLPLTGVHLNVNNLNKTVNFDTTEDALVGITNQINHLTEVVNSLKK